jgi:hypothetical protein
LFIISNLRGRWKLSDLIIIKVMKTILLKVDDDILDNVIWLLKSLSINEVQLIDDCEYLEENKLKEINADLAE